MRDLALECKHGELKLTCIICHKHREVNKMDFQEIVTMVLNGELELADRDFLMENYGLTSYEVAELYRIVAVAS
jgi:hypothetical protein